MQKNVEKNWTFPVGMTPEALIVNESLPEDLPGSFSVYATQNADDFFFLTLPELEAGMVFSISPSPALNWSVAKTDFSLYIKVEDKHFSGKLLHFQLKEKSFFNFRHTAKKSLSPGRKIAASNCVYRL